MRDILAVEESTKAVQGSHHAVELQSIRGLAALVVVVHHCTFYFRYDPSVKYGFEVALNAHAAVVSFFVLSGFVLTRSWGKKDLAVRQSYVGIWVTRPIRRQFWLALR